MERPVCGEIKRFINFPVPCLLVYDIEDDGHPIGQGRLLNKYLKFSQLLTFRTSQEPYWIADNLWDSVLNFLTRIDEGLAKRSSSLQDGRKGKGGVIPSEAFEDSEFSNFDLHIRTHHSEERKTFMEKTKEKKIIVKKKTKKIKNVIREEEEKMEQIQEEKPKLEEKSEKKMENKKKSQENLLFMKKEVIKPKEEEEHMYKVLEKPKNIVENKNDEKIIKKENQVAAHSKNEEEKKGEKVDNNSKFSPENNYLCPLCLDILFKPIQLPCNHNFCFICLNDLAFYETRCPLCRKEFSENYDKSEKNINQKLLSDMIANLPQKRLLEREQKALLDQQRSLNKKTLFMGYGYEYKEIPTKPRVGNAQTSRKFEWKVYLKQLNYLKQRMIKFVEFDINIGVIGSKPIKVDRPPFVLEGKGGFSFTALIRVTWDPNLKIKPYETFQRVDFGEGNRMKKFMIKLNQ